MLPKHLVPKTEPMANPENVYILGDIRVTVLLDRLFRIEKNTAGDFLDDATQCIWYRNTKTVEVKVKKTDSYVELSTDRATLHIGQSLDESFVILGDKCVPISNEGNLLGTTRTLDCYNGRAHIRNLTTLSLENGVCSRSGVAVIDDTKSLRFLKDGSLAAPTTDEYDLYVFAFGNDYRAAVRALYQVTGSTPMLPRYAFGNWWSRYHAYSDEEYLALMDAFSDYGIPLTVATVDMDWHYSNEVERQKGISDKDKCEELGTLGRIGWTGYSWNDELFADYKEFLRQLKSRNLAVTLNLHPADGVRYFEDMYREMATAVGIDPETRCVVPFDIANEKFVENYFKLLHHPYESDGVDFWWIDWQQGTNSSMAGLDPLWALNHYHYYDNGRDGKHPLIMSRYCGVGSHRYPIGFSGDTVISWETLELMPYFTATSSNIGYTWWGHDIGGHYLGVKDDELYLRFLQFGVFNPINRLHCCDALSLTKEPWAYKNGIGELSREAMVLRHRMIPMLHTANYRTATEGEPMILPMYYDYPDEEASYEASGQYIFARDMIVAPIVKHSDNARLCEVKVWIPEGKWTDMFTNDTYIAPAGGKWVTLVRSLDSIPVLVKAGAMLPFGNNTGNSTDNPEHLDIFVYSGNGEYTLYEDNSLGVHALTKFENRAASGTQTVSFRICGDTSVLPTSRTMTFNFRNICVNTAVDYSRAIGNKDKRFANITVLKDGKEISAKVSKYGIVKVTLENIDYSSEYEIKVEYGSLPAIAEIRRAVLLKLVETEGAYSIRNALQKAVETADTPEAIVNAIFNSDLGASQKNRLVETIV